MLGAELHAARVVPSAHGGWSETAFKRLAHGPATADNGRRTARMVSRSSRAGADQHASPRRAVTGEARHSDRTARPSGLSPPRPTPLPPPAAAANHVKESRASFGKCQRDQVSGRGRGHGGPGSQTLLRLPIPSPLQPDCVCSSSTATVTDGEWLRYVWSLTKYDRICALRPARS